MTSLFDKISEMSFAEAIDYILLLPTSAKEEYFAIGAIVYFVFGLIAFLLSITTIIIFVTTKKRKPQSNFANQTASDNAKHINFGVIVDEVHVESHGKNYKYFIIKDKNEQVDKLPISTVVIILKQSKTEAHVREATHDEIKNLKKQGLLK